MVVAIDVVVVGGIRGRSCCSVRHPAAVVQGDPVVDWRHLRHGSPHRRERVPVGTRCQWANISTVTVVNWSATTVASQRTGW